MTGVEKYPVFGKPDPDRICTSYVERQNATLRQHCWRLTRLTRAFSKKLESFKAAVALNFAYYNFCLRHVALGQTPAVAAGIEGGRWSVPDLVDAVA